MSCDLEAYTVFLCSRPPARNLPMEISLHDTAWHVQGPDRGLFSFGSGSHLLENPGPIAMFLTKKQFDGRLTVN